MRPVRSIVSDLTFRLASVITFVTVALVGSLVPALPSSAATSSTKLTVIYVAGPASAVQVWTLDCDTLTGTHPDVAGACELLATATTDLFAPVPSGTYCTMIYGGPQTAQVAGIWRDKQVYGSFARNDGCQLSRWTAMIPVLPKV